MRPQRANVPYSPMLFTRRKFEQLTKAERWGEPGGPEIQIELQIRPEGKIVVTGRETWGGQVPIPNLARAMRITSVATRPGEKYRFFIVWSGGTRWWVVQKARRRRGQRESNI